MQVIDGQNGYLIQPPLSIWDGILPSQHYFELSTIKQKINLLQTTAFEDKLADAMVALGENPEKRLAMRNMSLNHYNTHFSRGEQES